MDIAARGRCKGRLLNGRTSASACVVVGLIVACTVSLASCTQLLGLDVPERPADASADARADDGGIADTGPIDAAHQPDSGPDVLKGCDCPGFRDVPAAPLTPLARTGFAFAWTGREYLVWGGRGKTLEAFNDGAAFNPVKNTWRLLPPAPLAKRSLAGSVWLGDVWLIWGGAGDDTGELGDGALYNPIKNTWSKLADSGPLSARSQPFVAKVGGRALLWASLETSFIGAPNDGAWFDPSTQSWTPMAASPLSDRAPFAALGGSTLFVRGGKSNDALSPTGFEATGAEYVPRTNQWGVAHALPKVLVAQKELLALSCGAAMDSAYFIGRTPVDTSGSIGLIIGPQGPELSLPTPATSLSPLNATYTHAFCIRGVLGLFGTTKEGLPTGIHFDATTSTWSAIPSGGPKAFRSQSQVGGEEVFFWGGSAIVGDKPASHIYQP